MTNNKLFLVAGDFHKLNNAFLKTVSIEGAYREVAPGVYLLRSDETAQTLYGRFKTALGATDAGYGIFPIDRTWINQAAIPGQVKTWVEESMAA